MLSTKAQSKLIQDSICDIIFRLEVVTIGTLLEMWLSLILGAFILILAWDFCRKHQRSAILQRSKISGPISLLVLGNSLQASALSSENYLEYFRDSFNKYGKTFRHWILGECIVYTKDIKLFEAILSSSTILQKAEVYRFMRDFLGDGLFLGSSSTWASRRKVLVPAFHFKCLGNFVEIMDRNSEIMVEKLRKVADGKTPVDLFNYVSLEALDVITETTMGVQMNAQIDPNCAYTKALKSVVHIASDRLLSPWHRFNWLFPLAAPLVYRRLHRDIRLMQEFTDKIIRERRAILERSKADGSFQPLSLEDEETGGKSKMALLDIMLQVSIDNKPLTELDIRVEVGSFIFAGDDTTTSGVSHALQVISRHPKVQECIYQEILAVLGQDPNTPVTQSQLLDLKYLDCVIKETMRLYPPVPYLGRYIPKDLHVGDKTIPGNTSVILMPYYVYRDPEYFPDPLNFKPERWMNVKEASFPSHAYIPFSFGPKNCIGQRFAILQMKTLISKVIRHYELLPLGEDLKATFNFVLSSSSGFNVGLRPKKF